MHDRPWVHRDDGFRGWRAVAKSAVWSFCVVVLPPLFDQDLRLGQAVEDFAVEQLIAEPGVEALAISVLPWRTGLDVGRSGANGGDPVPHRLCDELRAVVGSNERRNTAQDEEITQHVDDAVGVNDTL